MLQCLECPLSGPPSVCVVGNVLVSLKKGKSSLHNDDTAITVQRVEALQTLSRIALGMVP